MEAFVEQNNNLGQKRPFPFWSVLLLGIMVMLIVFMLIPKGDNKQISSSEFHDAMANEQVAGVYIYGTTVRGVYIEGYEKNKVSLDDFKKSNGSKNDFHFSIIAGAEIDTLIKDIKEYNAAHSAAPIWYNEEPVKESWLSKIWPFIYILLLVLFFFLIFKSFKKMSGQNMDFGKNKARMEQNLKVRFSDVAGCEEEKKEMSELVEFLKNPKKFTDLGARIPKGVLMVGPPGTGKTLLGKAIAGEAGVPFFNITGSDFVEMFVGVGAARVRDLFETAKKNSPCLIFIDEIDAVGRQRGAGLGNTNDEREQTLNQLLVQMDGFDVNEGIIVIAATNRPDVLDPALLRAGRFDRRITVGYPDVKAREKILRLYAKDKPMAKNINYAEIARHLGPGTTGAEIENILNEAAILAARAGKSIITQSDIMEGTIKVAYGPQRRSAAVSEEDKVNTAYHESGHAIVSRTSKNLKQVVNEISIIPRGMAGGYTAPSTEKEMFMYTKEQLMDEIEVAMGGRAAEYIIYGKYSTGPSNDLEKATNIAREMITKYGMSDKLGPVCYSSGGEVFLGRDFTTRSNISEKTAELIDQEIKDMLEKAFQNAIKTINKHKAEMEVMVKVLLEKETIYSQEVDMILDGKSYEEVIEFINKRQKDHEKEDSEAKKAKEEPKDKAKEEEEKIEKIRKTALDAFYNTNQDEPVEEPKEQEKNKKEEKKQEKKSEESVKTESDDDNKQGEN